MTQETAEQYSEAMMSLSSQARSVVRDLNPKNELKYLRVRAKKHEIMVAFDVQFIVIVIQRWTSAGERT
eukprot:CAMPEP_0116957448 /NCGR_PEP_ID=MMETSP0467-20121206/43979_1 /TAXON_ID=283647 /ORGANISM="Mesodinium pulex, Strain SPMC105" /LENGTH=68 /DNA_ID=CAMNT_0004644203 /DNA_START=61 /DNA_END=263 /DNA_ORIENTATION=+